MKRNVKRLTLSRETVRYLNAEEMSAIHAGASTPFCPVTTAYVICATDSCPTNCVRTYCCAV